jgi:ABC-type branched-subunit amino acid transport system substrate-binding protein
MTHFPDSSHFQEAAVEILVTLFEEARYKEVLVEADQVLKKAVSSGRQVRINSLLGDAHSAMGDLAEAAIFYKIAYDIADSEERASLIDKFQEILTHLDSPSISMLLDDIQEKQLRGFLLFQLAQNHVDANKTQAAEKLLIELLQHSPEHEKADHAKSILSEIHEKATYDHNTIGCLLPLTGPYQVYGSKALKGIELALKQFMVDSGTSTIKLVIQDTGSDPTKTVKAVQYLAEKKVAAIIGPIISAKAAAIAAQEKQIPIIILSQKEDITSAGDFVFRNFITPKLQVNALVSFAVRELGAKRFAILYPDDKYGKTFMNIFWDEVIAANGKVVGVESYPAGHTDFADPIKKLTGLFYEIPEALKIQSSQGDGESGDPKEKWAIEGRMPEGEEDDGVMDNPVLSDKKIPLEYEEPKAVVDFDVIFIPDAPNTAGLIIPQLTFYDVKNIHLMGTNLWHSNKLIQMARQYVQNAIFTSGFNIDDSSKRVREFVRTFSETFGEKPGFIEAVAFDTATLLLQTMIRPDIQYRSRLKDELLDLNGFEGLTGETSFDQLGEAQKQLLLFRIEKDGFVEIQEKR